MVSQSLRDGDGVWLVPAAEKERHPGVVIRISKDGKNALVLTGTGTGPRTGYTYEVVDPVRRANKALQLKKTTYFYQDAVHVRSVSDLEETRRDEMARRKMNIAPRCPLALWEKLQPLALAGARARAAASAFGDWWPDDL